jgi:hypothetical protein
MYVVAVVQLPVLLINQPLTNLQSCQPTRGGAPEVAVQLFTLNIITGAQRHPPVRIFAQVPGAGTPWTDIFGIQHPTDAVRINGRAVIRFDPSKQLPRSALLLENGVIYVAFSSYMDIMPYHGWVMAYDTSTLKQLAVFTTTPNGAAAGIWQGGQGLAADPSGNVYGMSGNGQFDPGIDLSDSFFKLKLTKASAGASLDLVDWFSSIWSRFPDQSYVNTSCEGNSDCLSVWDADMGSAGPVIVPQGRIIGGGKISRLYSLGTAALGHLQTAYDSAFSGVFRATRVQPIPNCGDHESHIHGSPIYWDGPNGPTLYVWGENDLLRAYSVDTWTAPGKTTPDPTLPSPVFNARFGVPVATSQQPAACGMPDFGFGS